MRNPKQIKYDRRLLLDAEVVAHIKTIRAIPNRPEHDDGQPNRRVRRAAYRALRLHGKVQIKYPNRLVSA